MPASGAGRIQSSAFQLLLLYCWERPSCWFTLSNTIEHCSNKHSNLKPLIIEPLSAIKCVLKFCDDLKRETSLCACGQMTVILCNYTIFIGWYNFANCIVFSLRIFIFQLDWTPSSFLTNQSIWLPILLFQECNNMRLSNSLCAVFFAWDFFLHFHPDSFSPSPSSWLAG